MLRTIMIFPQLSNIDVIDEIRDRYDPLAHLVRPHVTLVFPFESEMTNDEVKEKLTHCIEHVTAFELELYGFSKADGNYLFLDISKGQDIIEDIHYDLYSNYFSEFAHSLPYTPPFIPHMTVGKCNSAKELDDAYEYVKKIDCRFSTVVKKISVEMIGEHEESIIAFECPLKER